MSFQKNLEEMAVKIGKKERKYIDARYEYFNAITIIDKIKLMEPIVGEVLNDCSEEDKLETLELIYISEKW